MQAAQPAAQFLAYLGVQRAERFVEQQYARLDGQGAGQRDTLALSARQLRRITVGQPIQLYQLQQILDLAADLVFRRTLAARLHAQTKGHVFKHGHVLEQRVMLKHETHLALTHVARRCIFRIQQDLTTVRMFQASNNAQQGSLAATRRAQQCRQFTAGKIERDIVESDEVAETLVDIFNCYRHDQCSVERKAESSAWFSFKRHSIKAFRARVTSASKASRDATANAAEKLYSLYSISTCSGIVLVSPRIWPDTTDTAPNSPMARALHRITPYNRPHLMFGKVTCQKVFHPEAPSTSAASSSSLPCDCISGISSRATKGKVTNTVASTMPGTANRILMSCSRSHGPK